jgi:hypothetical protein
MPGQAVKATFRYEVERKKPSPEYSRYFKYYTVTECQKILLLGPTLKRKSSAKLEDFKWDTMVGTVLSIKDDFAEVYIEGGRIVWEDGTENLAHGEYSHYIESGSVFMDVNGRAIPQSGVKPFQRVLIKVKDHNGFDGSYGYADSSIASMQVIEHGEKVISQDDGSNANFYRMAATVTRREKNAEGLWEYTVTPEIDRWERRYQAEYEIVNMDYGFGPNQAFAGMDLPVGTHIVFNYTGINYTKTPGRIMECSEAQIGMREG